MKPFHEDELSFYFPAFDDDASDPHEQRISTKLNILLSSNDYQVLYNYKSYLKEQADAFAKAQLDKYRARIAAPPERKGIQAAKGPKRRRFHGLTFKRAHYRAFI